MNSADSLEDSKDYEENHRLMVENVASMSAEFDYTPPKSPLEIDGERLLEVYPYLKDPANIEANILVYNYLSMMDQRAYSRASIEEMSDKFLSDIFNLGEPEELYSILKAACSEDTRVNISPHKISTQSVPAIFALLYISQTIYPDAMCKVLERRVYPCNNNIPRTMRVEYIFKFSGTRILSKYLMETFQEFLIQEGANLTSHDPFSKILDIIDNFISRIEVSSIPFLSEQTSSSMEVEDDFDRVSKLIFELVMIVEADSRLITQLDMEVLASNLPHLQNIGSIS